MCVCVCVWVCVCVFVCVCEWVGVCERVGVGEAMCMAACTVSVPMSTVHVQTECLSMTIIIPEDNNLPK